MPNGIRILNLDFSAIPPRSEPAALGGGSRVRSFALYVICPVRLLPLRLSYFGPLMSCRLLVVGQSIYYVALNDDTEKLKETGD